jgi:hypothetical protein
LSLPADFSPDSFARNMIRNYVGDALRYGIFNADPHPANLMIVPGSEVGYIDFGIVGKLNPYSRYYLISMTLAYARGDLDGLAKSFFEVSELDERSDRKQFRTELRELAAQWYAPGQERRLRKSITQVMLDLLNLSKRTSIWPRRDVIRYIRSAIVLDGLIKNFAPDLDFGRYLEEICEQHYLWYELEDLVSSDRRMSTCLSFLPQRDRNLAQQEVENLRDAVRHFGVIEPEWAAKLSSLPPLNDRIQAIARMERFEALWATEGLGFRVAESAIKLQTCPIQFLKTQEFGMLPASSSAAVHVGVSLSVGKYLLNRAKQPGMSLSEAVRIFVERCEGLSPDGCTGIAVEALGLVTRTLFPAWLNSVDRELQEIDPDLVGFFWHGVGRGLYFIFPPSLYSQGSHSIALEKAQQDPPHELGRANSMAGLAWPLTLVNIRHPEILATFLKRYAGDLSTHSAFSNGIATAVLLWLAWAGHDEYIKAIIRHKPGQTTLSEATAWIKLVREPCLEVMKFHQGRIESSRQFGELFKYQPLPLLADRLVEPQRVRAASGGER